MRGKAAKIVGRRRNAAEIVGRRGKAHLHEEIIEAGLAWRGERSDACARCGRAVAKPRLFIPARMHRILPEVVSYARCI